MNTTQWMQTYRSLVLRELVDAFKKLDERTTLETMTIFIMMELPAWNRSPFSESVTPYNKVIELIDETSTVLFDATEGLQYDEKALPTDARLLILAKYLFTLIVQVLLPDYTLENES